MPRVTHDDPDMVYACPECDHAGDIYERTGNGNAHAGDAEAPYRCNRCAATFKGLVGRPAREWQPGHPGRPGQHGLGKVLAEMTVEEFDAIVNGGEAE